MSWISYFIPQDIFRTSSPYNPNIRVQIFMGKRLVMVDGSQQSGAYIKMLWRRSCSAFGINSQMHAKNILVLGVGGGTVIRLLHEFFPKASIATVDIDPVMIKIAGTYFGLGDIKRLAVIQADAKEFVQKEVQKKKTYDCIVIDLFLGAHIPAFVESSAFLEDIKTIMAPEARVLINYLREKEYAGKSQAFADRLRSRFVVRKFPIFRNSFFLLE